MTYLGKTVLSEFVTWRYEHTKQKIDSLLDDEKIDDPDVWQPLFEWVPSVTLRPQFLALIHYVVFWEAVGYHIRYHDLATASTLTLLTLLEKPSNSPEDSRKATVEKCFMHACCRDQRYWEDVSLKLPQLMPRELAEVRATGVVPHLLYMWLLLFRESVDAHTEDIEGFHARLQKFHYNTRHASADAKMAIKVGHDSRPSECADVHGRVQNMKETDSYAQRFKVCGDTDGDDIPSAYETPPCPHNGGVAQESARLAAAFAYNAYRSLETSVHSVITFDLEKELDIPAVVLVHKFDYNVYGITGTVSVGIPGPEHEEPEGARAFLVDRPLNASRLLSLIEATQICRAGGDLYEYEAEAGEAERKRKRTPKQLRGRRFPVSWVALGAARMSRGEGETFTLTAHVSQPRKRRRREDEGSDKEGAAEEPAPGTPLEDMLARVLEEGEHSDDMDEKSETNDEDDGDEYEVEAEDSDGARDLFFHDEEDHIDEVDPEVGFMSEETFELLVAA